jgi:hypothetical protein
VQPLHVARPEIGTPDFACARRPDAAGAARAAKVLENAGLVVKTREAQWRPCRIKAAPLRDATNWMEQYRAFWEESFDRLEEYLKTAARRALIDPEFDSTAGCANAVNACAFSSLSS